VDGQCQHAGHDGPADRRRGQVHRRRRLGDDFIAYKQRALFLGRYSGAPEVWHWTQISSEIGCVGKTALANTGVMHLFVGEDDIYLYDGVRPQSIADGQVRRWFTTNRDPAYAYRTQVLWDRQNSLAYFFFASTTSAGVIDQGWSTTPSGSDGASSPATSRRW
jgi:hypothetical protein